MPSISVLNYCYSRQSELDHTLPKLLAQEGVEYDVMLAAGPDVKTPEHPRLKRYPVEQQHLCKAFNMLLKNATSDLLLITQCDMEINDPYQIKRMVDMWKPGRVITEKFFKQAFRNKSDGQLVRDPGYYLQMCLVAREEMVKIGGWHEEYEQPDMLGHEDGDIMASLFENGLEIYHTETPFDIGVFHLDHRVSYWDNGEDEYWRRINNAKALFRSRHREDVKQIYARQMLRRYYAPKT